MRPSSANGRYRTSRLTVRRCCRMPWLSTVLIVSGHSRSTRRGAGRLESKTTPYTTRGIRGPFAQFARARRSRWSDCSLAIRTRARWRRSMDDPSDRGRADVLGAEWRSKSRVQQPLLHPPCEPNRPAAGQRSYCALSQQHAKAGTRTRTGFPTGS